MHRGSCLCGCIAYELDAELGDAVYCHCRRCRKAGGSAFAASAPAPFAALRVLRGGDALKGYRSEAGLHRMFCGQCGSPLYSRRESAPDTIRLRLGSLDTPAPRPSRHIFVADKAEWFDLHDDLPQFATWP